MSNYRTPSQQGQFQDFYNLLPSQVSVPSSWASVSAGLTLHPQQTVPVPIYGAPNATQGMP